MILGTEKMSGDGKRSDEETLALAQRIESIERTYQDYLALKRDLCDKLKHWWQVEWQVIRKALEREGGELSACVDTCLSEINAHLLELNRKMEGVIIEMDEKLCVAETERKKEETREWVETVSV